jgi:hypothetical protein
MATRIRLSRSRHVVVGRRDIFLGEPRCVVCGEELAIQHYGHIIEQSEVNFVSGKFILASLMLTGNIVDRSQTS